MRGRGIPRRTKALLEQLRALAAPGYEPRPVPQRTCRSGKRRWPTEHAAAAALKEVRAQRKKRSRGRPLGSLESRMYACDDCAGYHLTSAAEVPEWVRRDDEDDSTEQGA